MSFPTFLNFLYRQLFVLPQPAPKSIDLSGKTVLVTGANVGLGLEATRQLISLGVARVILGVRTPSTGETARVDLLTESPNCTIEVWKLDLESLASVAAFAKRAQGLDRLDLVLLNAGLSKVEFVTASSGHEMTVQVNHISTALLSLLLLPPLKATAKLTGEPSRLTITSSEVGFWAKFEERKASNILQRLDESDAFTPNDPERYNTSKTLNILWTRQLAFEASSNDVVINTVNPGLCHSTLHRDDPSKALKIFKKIFARTTTQGGRCLVNALVVQGVDSHGAYISEQKITKLSGVPASHDAATIQDKLWRETLDVIKHDAPDVEMDVALS